MEDGKTPRFSPSFPFPIYHFSFRPAFFIGLLVRHATVTSVRRATPTTRIVRVRPEGEATPFAYRPGQAAEIAPESAGGLTTYSIASAPEDTGADGQIEFLVKVDAHGRWGDHCYPALGRGQRIRLKGPVGRFVFPARPSDDRFLFIAGGTGIAPLRAMIRHGRARGYGRFHLLYSARTPHDFAYRHELCGMARRGELELTLTATRDFSDTWKGERGRITSAQLAALLDDPATLCFVCGPAAMVDDVPRMLRELGVDRTRIRIEEG
jgi:ferredoxin-NADP reductase